MPIARRAEILLGVKCVIEEDDAGGEAIDGIGGVWEVCVCAGKAEKWRGVLYWVIKLMDFGVR